MVIFATRPLVKIVISVLLRKRCTFVQKYVNNEPVKYSIDLLES